MASEVPRPIKAPLEVASAACVTPSAVPDVGMIRAGWAKFTLSTIAQAPSHMQDAVRSAIPASVVSEIRRAPRFGWQDASTFTQLATAIHTVGEELAREFWRHSLRTSVEQPLISPLVRGGLAIFGNSPAALYLRTPRAYQLMTRACGHMTAEADASARSATLTVSDLPPAVRRSGMLRMWEGGFIGQAEYTGNVARVVTYDADFFERGTVVFEVRW